MRVISLLIVLSAAALASGCYSFTGSSVPSHLKTIAIALFEDQSGFGEPGMREKFTRQLIELFTSDNSLELADRTTADSILEGTITSMRDEPA
ncbi:MAG: LPS assembly lipoprotein LptE, partial [Acidobacteriota bacterium]